jgi:CRISPR-associated RAMP protein (TIGR02581 family)
MNGEAPMDFTTFHRRVSLRGLLITETGLRVANGHSDDVSDADMAVFKDAQRRPFIPGSSVKGALRAQVERIVRAVWTGDERRGACDPLDERQRCVTAADMNALREQHGRDSGAMARGVLDQTCRVCRVFGSPWLASKVMVRDLRLMDPELWAERRYEVRAGVGIERDAGAAKTAVLYNSQVVAPGTAFDWEIVIENANPVTEEPLVYLGLREMMQGRIPLGGARSRGLGQVQLSVEAAEAVDGGSLLEYLVSGQGTALQWSQLEQSIGDCVRALNAAGSGGRNAQTHAE